MSVVRLNSASQSASGCPFPVGAVFITFAGGDPSAYWPGTAWQQLTAGTFLAASGDGYAINATGGAASVKLTSAQSGVPAHSHDLNGHTHSTPAHTHTLSVNDVGGHTHTLNNHTHSVPNHKHTIRTVSPNASTSASLNTDQVQFGRQVTGYANTNPFSYDKDHGTSNTGGGACTTGQNNGNTSSAGGHSHGLTWQNSGGGTSGKASGNTANNTAADAGAAHENRPPYIAVAMWKRTA